MLEIMRLAYEVNEAVRWTFVSIDYNKGMGTTVRINDCVKAEIVTYTSTVHDTDENLLTGGIYVSDPGFVQAEAALKALQVLPSFPETIRIPPEPIIISIRSWRLQKNQKSALM